MVVVAVFSSHRLPIALAADGSIYLKVGMGFEVAQEHLLSVVKVKKDIQVLAWQRFVLPPTSEWLPKQMDGNQRDQTEKKI
ncbi:hypothetical protein Pcinc_033288 [Petrolisthes cinctipes]|uniref:Uncharacterized protein n=1 Tax=Petrolisthes cinctipes TaxID=88211 RepID=A0AAE1ESP8_PETCI|nr:hypothetical protein Pcinc_033288 [Petrolisthes cinctipes]